MSRFSERLKELRNTKRLSQQKFADCIGIAKSSVNMYERGEREPGLETIEAIADFYNVDLDYLIGKTNIPNKALVIGYEDTTEQNSIVNLYNQLDTIDKAEIRGEIKQMLKSDKYTAADKKSIIKKTYIAQIAAQGHGVKNIEVSANMDEIQKIYDDLD